MAKEDVLHTYNGILVSHKTELDPESWTIKKAEHKELMLERTLERPLDCKEIKPVHPKENQPWIFIGRTGAEAPILGSPDAQT